VEARAQGTREKNPVGAENPGEHRAPGCCNRRPGWQRTLKWIEALKADLLLCKAGRWHGQKLLVDIRGRRS
jgi:hypothetical protein